jgi:hypothetical protein
MYDGSVNRRSHIGSMASVVGATAPPARSGGLVMAEALEVLDQVRARAGRERGRALPAGEAGIARRRRRSGFVARASSTSEAPEQPRGRWFRRG